MGTDGTENGKGAGAIVRQEFGASQIVQQQAELAAIAVAAQAKAAVEARYVIALRQPRDLDEVRQRLLRECARPSFAEVARYHKPIGQGVEGPSIRFAEAAVRCMGNILVEQMVVFDDDAKRLVRLTVSDLEANASYSGEVTIPKRIERSRAEDGRTIYGQRRNSRGGVTYTVSATDDEILDREGALISKRIRTLALRLIPGDLIDEAMAACIATQTRRDAEDPDAARKKLIDAFATINVRASELKTYLGLEDLGAISPADTTQLRALYAAIRDGETTWRDALDARRPAEGEAKTESAALSTIKRKLASAQTPAPQTPAAKTTPAPQTTPAPTEEEIP